RDDLTGHVTPGQAGRVGTGLAVQVTVQQLCQLRLGWLGWLLGVNRLCHRWPLWAETPRSSLGRLFEKGTSAPAELAPGLPPPPPCRACIFSLYERQYRG